MSTCHSILSKKPDLSVKIGLRSLLTICMGAEGERPSFLRVRSMPNPNKIKSSSPQDDSIRRRARAFQRVERNGRVGWLYEWNTGAIDIIFPPEDFTFDRSKAQHLQVRPAIND